MKYLIVFLLLTLSACSVTRVPENLGYGVLNQDDLEITKEGLPTYLLMIDGLLLTYPESTSLLLTAASLNSAYGGVFVEEEARKLKLIEKAFALSQQAICIHKKTTCSIKTMPFEEFEQAIEKLNKEKDLPYLYSLGSTWASYIQLTSDDFNSIAELARVEFIMKKIVDTDSSYEFGMPLVYLGVLNSLIPPSLGGKPDVAKNYFEQAVAVSEENLIAKVMFAESYGRLMFDQELHDGLLNEVLEADSEAHGLTLQNEFAKKEAQRLLAESPDYF